MMNDFENIPAESDFQDALDSAGEPVPMDIDGSGSVDQDTRIEPEETPLGEIYGDGEDNDQGWPGDGSGTDDLADFNSLESLDYSNE